MNPISKRIIFWGAFIIVLALVVWGMIVASEKSSSAALGNSVTPISISHPLSSDDWTVGSSSAPVQLVEYADFQCPACAEYSSVVKQLLTDEAGKIYFGYRYFPLPQHANALSSAYAATAAGLQGKFWEMHDLLFTGQADWQDLADPTSVFAGYAKTLGLDQAKFTADINSDAVHAKVKASYDDSTAMGLDYTPTFFVNGKRIANPQSYASFKSIIETAAQSHS